MNGEDIRVVDREQQSQLCSGGIHIVQILNTIEGDRVGDMGHNGAATIHLMAEAMKHAYADRSEYLGDPDFVKVPSAALTSKAYAKEIRAKIDMDKAMSAEDIKPGMLAPYESAQTTHFSIVDQAGNAVALFAWRTREGIRRPSKR